MISTPPFISPPQQHERIRRAKRWLRFMPRKAVFHRYPLVGRFAAFARREEYLWSFRRTPIRRALYVGSILAFLPLLGVQLVVGLVLAIVARTNFMVLGALQLITNPFTVVPIYGATFVLGRRVLNQLGFPMRGARLPEGWTNMGLGEIAAHLNLGTAIGQGFLCLVVGGVVAGIVFAAILDAVYCLGNRTGAQQRPSPPPDPPSPEI